MYLSMAWLIQGLSKPRISLPELVSAESNPGLDITNYAIGLIISDLPSYLDFFQKLLKIYGWTQN